jgi:hypothetical protein
LGAAEEAVNPDQQFAVGVSSNAAWYPKDSTLDMLVNTMKVDRCVANIMTGVNGCKCSFPPWFTKPICNLVSLMIEKLIIWICAPILTPKMETF